MIKTFENCSPEYQITIVWFFIFLTLLCMILVIYEGTGKRQRKTLLLDSVLLIVIFLITAVLCVWQRAFYEEDSMILFKIPYVILIVIGIGVFLYVGMKIFGIYKYRKSCLRENAVQESLDNLPSGIVFFDGNGMPKLMNRKMYQICQNLTGRDIQNITELEEALGHVVLPILDGHAGCDKQFTTIENNALDIIEFVNSKLGGSVLMMGGLSLGGQICLMNITKILVLLERVI